jgi:hypothetical protein
VLGPERTITDRQLVTETQVVDRTQTDVTKIQPTTVVVTDLRTETVREVETQHVNCRPDRDRRRHPDRHRHRPSASIETGDG